jgi:hypothetical protein
VVFQAVACFAGNYSGIWPKTTIFNRGKVKSPLFFKDLGSKFSARRNCNCHMSRRRPLPRKSA